MSPEMTDFNFIPAATAAGTLRGFSLWEVFDSQTPRGGNRRPGGVFFFWVKTGGPPGLLPRGAPRAPHQDAVDRTHSKFVP